MKKLLSLLFVILLSAPLTLEWVGSLHGKGIDRTRQGFPRPGATYWRDRDYYQAVNGWFQDSLMVDKPLQILNNWLDYQMFSTSDEGAVHIGIHDWLFAEETRDPEGRSAPARHAGQRLFLTLHAAEKIIGATGRRMLIAVIPDKADIYPEYVGSRDPVTTTPVFQALIAADKHHPLNGFVRLGPVLKKAKLSGIEVYHKRSRLWSCDGAAAGAAALLASAHLPRPIAGDPSGVACRPADTDLYRQLLGKTPLSTAPTTGYKAGPYAVDGPQAVVYGDDYLISLLPYMSRAFKAVDIIDAAQFPTVDGRVLSRPADLVMLERGADGLARLRLNLESLYVAAGPQIKGMLSQDIALDKAEPLSGCSLDNSSRGLQIRSAGEGAFFSLPSVAGSTDGVFRMMKLTFEPSHQGRITVRTRPDGAGWIKKTINRDIPFLIIPLPFVESTTLRINPSRHPGVFTLQRAELLSFYGNHPPPVPREAARGDIYSGLEIEPNPTPDGDSNGDRTPEADVHPPPSPPVLGLTDIDQNRIFQRQDRQAAIVVTGSYRGAAGPVEARVVAADGDAVVVPWTVVDDSPENGHYTGILPAVPQGGWYHLQVRSRLDTEVKISGDHRWGVGMLIACIGQSNMNQWFYAGSASIPSPLLMVYRQARWIEPGRAGNGALALGNRLASRLKIPIGLLDYAVDGSGLTPKAEWGTGFWLDTRSDGIYRRFVDAVDTIGGTVEYVIWMQGEADAARGTVSRGEYRNALEQLVDGRIRADIRNGSTRARLPFLMIPLVKRPTGRDLSCQRIREAQMDALDTIGDTYLAALSIDLKNRGRQHLMPAAYTTLGLRTAQTILFLLGRENYHRGPAITAVRRMSDRVIAVTLRHRGGTDFTPWTGISGFEVLSGRQPLAIASVSRQDARTIRIELEEDAPQDVHVRYLYGAHPDTANAVRDNTALRLPLEPFSH